MLKAAVMTAIATVLTLVGGILGWLGWIRYVHRTQQVTPSPAYVIHTWQAKTIVQGLRDHQSTHGCLPRDHRGEDGTPLSSWRFALLPSLDLSRRLVPPWDGFRTDEPWDGPHNLRIASSRTPGFFLDRQVPPGRTPFLGFRGEHTIQPPDGRRLTLADITDGPAATLALVLVGPAWAVPWTQPTDLDLDTSDMASIHAALPERDVICAFFDGRVVRLPKRPSPILLKALITIDGGESIDLSEVLPGGRTDGDTP